MSTLSAATFTALMDSVAKSLVDIQSGLVSGPSSTVTAVTAGLGTSTPSLVERVLALQDAGLETLLLPATVAVANNVTTQLVTATSLSSYHFNYASLFDVLETLTGGAAAFCTANSIQLHEYAAAAFNTYAARATAWTLRSPSYTVNPIPVSQIFPATAITLGTFSPNGAAGVWTPASSLDTTRYGPVPLYYQLTNGNPSWTTGSQVRLSIQPAAGAATVYVTFTAPLPITGVGPLTSLGISGTGVLAGTTLVQGTDPGANYVVTAQPPRVVAY